MSARVSLERRRAMWIGGAFVTASLGPRKDVRDAVAAAKAAEAGWAKRSPESRQKLLFALAETLESRRFDLEHLLSKGAAVDAARAELDSTVDAVVHWAGFADKVPGLFSETFGPDANAPACSVALGVRPLGVVGFVAPSRPSLFGAIVGVLPWLVAGNTAVCVVSERDPAPALLAAEAFSRCGFPPGALNVLAGRVRDLALELARHGDVSALEAFVDAPLEDEVAVIAAARLARVVRTRRDPHGDASADALEATSRVSVARLEQALVTQTTIVPR
jgi:acyl-CoA reductase-like NAD-dependent aldehyde dehydrogenase